MLLLQNMRMHRFSQQPKELVLTNNFKSVKFKTILCQRLAGGRVTLYRSVLHTPVTPVIVA